MKVMAVPVLPALPEDCCGSMRGWQYESMLDDRLRVGILSFQHLHVCQSRWLCPDMNYSSACPQVENEVRRECLRKPSGVEFLSPAQRLLTL